VTLLDVDLAWQEATTFFKAGVDREERRWRTPGDLAREIDPRTINTPALDLIDQALVDLADGKEHRLAIFMSPQEGKLIADETPVPTPEGWIRHGDLRPGSVVFHPSGQQVKVADVHPPQLATLRVHFSDHTSVVVHRAHEWTVWDRGRSRWITLETQQLARLRLSHGPPGKRGHRYRFHLPLREPLDCPDRDLPVDPYTLGVWLGDGSTSKPAVTHHPDDRYELPYPETARCVHPATGIVTTYYGGGLLHDLREAGVLGNKHIPSPYLRASVRQRRALLAGLIDTDGHVAANGQVSFDNANADLVHRAAELIRSLGYRAHVHRPTPPKLSSSGIQGKQAMWRVTFTPHDHGPARLPRKAAVKLGRRERVAITSITEEAPRPGRCITVESDDGLYLVGEGMLATHNSERASHYFPLWMLVNNPDCRIAIVSYSGEIARRWGWLLRQDIETYNGTDGNIDLGLRLGPRPPAGRFTVEGHRGGVYCVGIAGSLTGRAVDLLIIDDPIKDLEQAQSIRYRDRAGAKNRSARAPMPSRHSTNSPAPGTRPAWTAYSRLARRCDPGPIRTLFGVSTIGSTTGATRSERSTVDRRDRWKEILKGVDPDVCLPDVWVALLDRRPRPSPDEASLETGLCGRSHVVVQPIAHVHDLIRFDLRGPHHAAKNPGSGFANPQSSEVATMSQGRPRPRRIFPARLVWLPATPTQYPSSRSRASAGRTSG
jgi:hypothetical protein